MNRPFGRNINKRVVLSISEPEDRQSSRIQPAMISRRRAR